MPFLDMLVFTTSECWHVNKLGRNANLNSKLANTTSNDINAEDGS